MVALVHDVVITAGIYALVGRQVTPETVIAILTILGFSLYDTVVIYDKIKENTESAALTARLGYTGVVDMSLNQTVMRSVNTSLVVLLPILSLLLFGGDTLKDFAFAMFVGVAIGAYSSIFIAAPVLTIVHERQVRRAAGSRRRAGARDGHRRAAASAIAVDAAATKATAGMGGTKPKPKAKPRNKRASPPSASGGRPVQIEQIEALIRDVPDFPEPGIVFKDITPVLADPIAFSTIIDLIVVHFGRGNVDKVVGIEARGFILGAPVAYHFGAGLIPVRKKGKLPVRDDRGGVRPRVRDGHAGDPHRRRHPGRAGAGRRRRPGHRRDRGRHREPRRADRRQGVRHRDPDRAGLPARARPGAGTTTSSR